MVKVLALSYKLQTTAASVASASSSEFGVLIAYKVALVMPGKPGHDM